MASRSKKALREIAYLIPTRIIVDEFIRRFENGLIELPPQESEADEDGFFELKLIIKEDD